MSLHADLTSVMSTLDQMFERLDDAAKELQNSPDDDLLSDIYEIERHLRQASRRLTRTLNSLPEGAKGSGRSGF
ncbi:MAG TPA: hypothetical protein VL068_11505 [Microthrixaceae bacterium]|nr:hypothetical protein [Microthrixaceae bacterium]